MRPILYCATTNVGKLREFQEVLRPVYTVRQIPGMREIAAPDETGATFEENAILKAMYYSRFCEEPVFADDSGLEVDALGGSPGVISARYAGEGATDEANNRLVVERMRGVADRTARFVCVIALAARRRLLATYRGAVEGELLEAPRGTGGFGYDPLFFFPPFGCTFGEAEAERKNTVSHRAQALRAMLRGGVLEVGGD